MSAVYSRSSSLRLLLLLLLLRGEERLTLPAPLSPTGSIRKTAEEVFLATGKDKLLDIAIALHDAALADG